ncbi:MAG: class I SAM-dependent methyltransferase [Chloroflexia bacterium]|nr:class I SAM-dependent methyltransferase [Chloroflexia bacterium]
MYYAQVYRWRELLHYLGISSGPASLLDVGCRDGFFLRGQPARLRVGLDLDPQPLPGSLLPLVRADALQAPLRPASFETIFSFDVIEHIPDDRRFLQALVELLAPGGTLWLSTPCADFRIWPAFLTARANRGWGHLRNGYSAAQIQGMLPPGCQAEFRYWNAPFLRAMTLPLHLLSFTWPWLARQGALLCAWLDHFFPRGRRGHLIACIDKLPKA